MRRNSFTTNLLLAATLTLGAAQAQALTELSDDSLSEVQGAGLTFSLDDFRFQMAPTSYIEQVGDVPAAGTTFNRGDLRWHGLTISSATTSGVNWQGTACSSGGLNGMACPMSNAGIESFATHNNPYLLRVFDYTRVGLDGADWVGGTVSNGVSIDGVTSTVLELLGPSDMDPFRWSFWGDIQVSTTDPAIDLIGSLQNQNIILGKAAARLKPPSLPDSSFANPANRNDMVGPALQLFQNQSDTSLGLLYHSRLSGDYRLSVNFSGTNDGIPIFTEEEGMYFSNVNAFLPLGTLHYQSIILDDIHEGSSSPGTTGNGNFVIELTRLPSDSEVIADFYSSAGAGGYQRTNRPDRYYQTHGYVEWGDKFPTCSGANCMSGSGVANMGRFSGSGSSVSKSLRLPDRAVIATNFPGDQCTSGAFGGYGGCDDYSGGVAPAVTLSYAAGGATVTDGRVTREALAAEGGIMFFSRDASSTWKVFNNQSDKQGFIDELNSRDDVMRARTDTQEYGCGIFGTGCDHRLVVQQNPGVNTIQNAANNIRNDYGSVIEVNAINLGTARVEGLLLHHMKITSLGAGL